MISKDLNNAMNFMPDDFWKIIPRTQMVSALEKAFNTSGVEFEIKDPKVIEVGVVKQIGKKFYAPLQYSNVLIMKIRDGQILSKDEKNRKFSSIQSSLEQTFGSGNVKLNENDESFEMLDVKNVWAISKDGKTDWRFLVLEKDQIEVQKRILPAALIPKFD